MKTATALIDELAKTLTDAGLPLPKPVQAYIEGDPCFLVWGHPEGSRIWAKEHNYTSEQRDMLIRLDELIAARETAIVAAADGYAVVRMRMFAETHFGGAVSAELIEEVPVIGWEIQPRRSPRGVMLWDPPHAITDALDMEVRCLRLPDGRVEYGEKRFASVSEWRAHVVAKWTKSRDREARGVPAFLTDNLDGYLAADGNP